jgi:hypothetical protein
MLPVTLQAGTDIAPGTLDHAAGPASTRGYEEHNDSAVRGSIEL